MKAILILSYITLILSFKLSEKLNKEKLKNNSFKYEYELVEHEATRLGYLYEEYHVETIDGYINTYWRIPAKNDTPTKIGKPILLQHGFTDTGFTFFQQKENSIVFKLVDNGFDCWIPNTRGTYRSHDHVELDYSDPNGKYWDYTLDDIVEIDLPRSIEFIKEQTGYSKIDYLGDSQGCTLFYLSFMNDPAYLSRNIAHYVSLAGAISMAHSPNPILSYVAPFIDIINDLIPTKRMLFLDDDLHTLLVTFANTFPDFTSYLGQALTGYYPSNKTDWSKITDWFYYYPGGVSKRNFLHWLQNYNKETWTKYDFDDELINKEHYGTIYPPEYKMDNYKLWDIPTFVTFSDNDSLSSQYDLKQWYNLVQKKDLITIFEAKDYNHADILDAPCAVVELFPKIIEFLNSPTTNKK